MKLNFQTVLTTLDGTPIQKSQTEDSPCTVGFAVVESLLGVYGGEQQGMTGIRTVERYTLAQKVHASTAEIDVTVEEVSEMKRLLALRWPPLIAGQACLLLEGSATKT